MVDKASSAYLTVEGGLNFEAGLIDSVGNGSVRKSASLLSGDRVPFLGNTRGVDVNDIVDHVYFECQ